MTKNVYVGNLSYDTNQSGLQELFEAHGQVSAVNIITDRYSGRSRGFAFVEMSTRSEGHKAMETLNKMDYKHRQLVCNEAKPQKKGRRRR